MMRQEKVLLKDEMEAASLSWCGGVIVGGP
jgi:hypothetical protein